jgi:hypothetical protein
MLRRRCSPRWSRTSTATTQIVDDDDAFEHDQDDDVEGFDDEDPADDDE